MPNWSDIHPAVIHFPIALLFIAPLFSLLGAITKKPAFQTAFLILLCLGTLGTLVAVSTGEAAGEKITMINDALLETLDEHESLAEKSRNIFILLSLAGLLWPFLRIRLSKTPQTISTAAVLIFICSYSYGLFVLSNAAHHGGELVHRHGVHSGLYNETK